MENKKMSSRMKDNEQLIFAPFIRVSTEKQAQRGESLNIQTKGIKQFVGMLGGIIPQNCWEYCGNEHSTPGYEKEKLNRLLEDSKTGTFNAVIVYDPSRWSRDNLMSKAGLQILRENGIRFFTVGQEWDLFNPDHMHILGIQVESSEYQALSMQRKSILSRIDRAKKGIPVSRPLPSGRTYDLASGKWGVNEVFKAKIQKAAVDFVDGKSLGFVARKMGMSRSNLRNIFLFKAGKSYIQKFRNPRFNIDEEIITPIPPLLDDQTIEKIRHQFQLNKTVGHGQSKYQYLLSRCLLCSHCGRAFVGWTDKIKRVQYYRHSKSGCLNLRLKSLLAEPLEKLILLHLFDLFGDINAIKKAADDALPNIKVIQQLKKEKEFHEKQLKGVKAKMNNLLKMVEAGGLNPEDIKGRMSKHRERCSTLLAEMNSNNVKLANLPTEDDIGKSAEEMAALKRCYFKTLHHLIEMPFEEKRELIQSIFSGKRFDGKRPGIYLSRGKNWWCYTINGNLINWGGAVGRMGAVPDDRDELLDDARVAYGLSEIDDDLTQLRRYLREPLQKFGGMCPPPINPASDMV